MPIMGFTMVFYSIMNLFHLDFLPKQMMILKLHSLVQESWYFRSRIQRDLSLMLYCCLTHQRENIRLMIVM